MGVFKFTTLMTTKRNGEVFRTYAAMRCRLRIDTFTKEGGMQINFVTLASREQLNVLMNIFKLGDMALGMEVTDERRS